MAGYIRDVAADVLGAELVRLMPAPVMGAEDFSYVLEEVPARWRSSARCRPITAGSSLRTTRTAWCSTRTPWRSGVAVYAAAALSFAARVVADE